MESGVRRVTVADLSPQIHNALIIGVIIAKQSINIFTSKNDSKERAVWNFTLRDSPNDMVNATYWGSPEKARRMFQMFQIGDVVEMTNPKIMYNRDNVQKSSFMPTVSSHFQLHLEENISDILPYIEGSGSYRSLMHVPTKAATDVCKLSDILKHGQEMKGQLVNLLVAVKRVGEVRSGKTKRQKDFMCRNVFVTDHMETEFIITLWSENDIRRADFWRPCATVLFIADLRLDWDSRNNWIAASTSSCTIIVVNPNTPEADKLRNYFKMVPLKATDIIDRLADTMIDPSSINTVMTTAQVLEKAYSGSATATENKFTAKVFVLITHLDLDGLMNIITYKCSLCSSTIAQPGICPNDECTSEKPDLKVLFDIRVNLTDHRGTLQNCRLTSPAAERVLQCSIEDFLKMKSVMKTNLKWRFLLTRCEARVMVLCSSPGRPNPLISLVDCTPATSEAISSEFPIF